MPKKTITQSKLTITPQIATTKKQFQKLLDKSTPIKKPIARILLTDDQMIVRDGLSLLIENNHGYECVQFPCTTNEELTLLTKQVGDLAIDLIITGLDQGQIHGFDILNSLRKLNLDIPVIVLTSVSDPKLIEEAVKLGAKFCIRKRDAAETLLSTIQAVLAAKKKDMLGRKPLNEAKLIFVGRGLVGKTSLINRLIWNSFDEEERKTEGIRITEWPLKLNEMEQVRLNVWDFGGQEIMHRTHQFFLSQNSLYVLVVSGRSGLEEVDAEYWLKMIESFGGESPVIIVKNKIKEQLFEVNRRALWQKYPFIVRDSFLSTDCEDATGIEDLRRMIERETDRLEHLRDPFPISWFKIKDEITRQKKSYLSFDEYRKICSNLGESEEDSQDALAFYLHHLGIALNFKDDPRLQDTHVINPHWVTEGIYAILNARQLAEQRGELQLRDLKGWLRAKDYPATMHRFLLDLMKKFELCFSFPDDDTHYLIPELLDIQEPAAAAEFKAAECLNFRYEYDVLPEGLLPRFIVRTHGLSEGEARWRTGVILRFEEGRALVKGDLADRRVFIHVNSVAGKGGAEARRRLLAVIRSDFERIHHDLRFKPAELVPLFDHPDEAVTYEELKVYEQSGMPTFTKVVSGKVIQVDVQELLNGVDLEGTRRRSGFDENRREAMLEMREEPIRVFISYAHKDERFRLQLEPHLKLLQRTGQIATWHDRLIKPGAQWADAIDANLEQAKIILLLVSSDFIASDYCYEKEMKRALERHAAKEAVVIPIIIRDCQWTSAPFAKLQALPKDGKAVDLWTKRDTAWRNVANGIEKVAQKLRQRRSSSE